MSEFFKIATFAFTFITVAFLLLDHVKIYLSSRVRFNLILSDFEVLEEAQVVKMDMVIVNHSSSNLAIIAMYYLEDGVVVRSYLYRLLYRVLRFFRSW